MVNKSVCIIDDRTIAFSSVFIYVCGMTGVIDGCNSMTWNSKSRNYGASEFGLAELALHTVERETALFVFDRYDGLL